MVSLSVIKSSNPLISSTLPPNLVAFFIGGTSGIGETTLKQFAKHAKKPRAYFLGRSQEAGDRITAECRKLNPEGEYIFIKADVSLIREVDQVCKEIKEKENAINLLFLSAGVASLDRTETSEHLHLLTALAWYSRIRFITNLLPLIQNSTSLRRVVLVGGGGHEGRLDPNDFPALHVPLRQIRGHIITMKSLGLEAVAKTAPDVSFVHNYPGTVDTALFTHIKGVAGVVMRTYLALLGRWVCIPVEECGERQLYMSTSAKYPALKDGCPTVPLGDGIELAQGTNGEAGGGVYSITADCESSPLSVTKLLADYRDEGMVERIWSHTESEFKRILG